MPLNSAPDLFDEVQTRFGAKVTGRQVQSGRPVLVLDPAAWAEIIAWLKNERGFDFLMELTGADYSGYPGHQGPPLCVTAHLFSVSRRERLWLKAFGPLDGFKIQTLDRLYACANWYERECFDMYGVVFEGHPYLKRLLLYDEFVGHPLRKDYPIMKMQPLIPMRNAVDYEAVAVARRQEPAEAPSGAKAGGKA